MPPFCAPLLCEEMSIEGRFSGANRAAKLKIMHGILSDSKSSAG